MKSGFVLSAVLIAMALLAASRSVVAQAPAQVPAKKALDAPVTGEDLELGPQKSALARLRDKLKRASSLLAEKRTDNAVVDLQVEIEFDLQDLLQQTGGPSSQASSGASQSTADESTHENSPDNTNSHNAEKNNSASKNGANGANRSPLKSLLRDAWGHLPDRARQELQSVSGEDFLPKYQRMIERYYRRLADEAARKKRESPAEETSRDKRP